MQLCSGKCATFVWRAGGLGEALGFPLDGGPAHHPCARPQVPFIVPLTEASAQLIDSVLFNAFKEGPVSSDIPVSDYRPTE